MSDPTVLVYTDARTAGATFQIRIAAPLHDAGFEILHVDDLPLTSLLRDMHDRIDALVVHRGIRKRCQVYDPLVTAARRAGKPVVYDVDDLLVTVPEDHPDFAIYQSRAIGALKVLTDADLVVASTPALADHLTALHPQVTVEPNRLPLGIWEPASSARESRRLDCANRPLTIGYIGTHTHTPDLELVEEAVVRLLDSYPGRVRFLAVGLKPSLRLRSHAAVECIMPSREVQRSYAEFARYAAGLPIDIGIAPLLDITFNHCKSNIKYQEYAALGIPGVYSDLPPYRDSVQNGQTGLLATTLDDWTAALTRLVESPTLRTQLATAAWQQVAGSGATAGSGKTWQGVLQTAAELANDPATSLQRKRAAAVIGQIFAYQSDLQRQLKWTVEYQVSKTWQRWLRKHA